MQSSQSRTNIPSIVSNWETYRKKCKNILELNGNIIIDGNHAFINSLEIQRRLNQVGLPKVAQTYFSEERANGLSYIAQAVIYRFKKYIQQELSEQYGGNVVDIWDAIERIHTGKIVRDDEVVLDGKTEITIVDALFDEYTMANIKNNYANLFDRNNVEGRLKRGLVPMRGNSDREEWVNKDCKNEFSARLAERIGSNIMLGKRKVHHKKITSGEKGVDVTISIIGTEAARNRSTDFIALVTNDEDFIPLVEHIKSKNKDVFVLNMGINESKSLQIMLKERFKSSYQLFKQNSMESRLEFDQGYQKVLDFCKEKGENAYIAYLLGYVYNEVEMHATYGMKYF